MNWKFFFYLVCFNLMGYIPIIVAKFYSFDGLTSYCDMLLVCGHLPLSMCIMVSNNIHFLYVSRLRAKRRRSKRNLM